MLLRRCVGAAPRINQLRTVARFRLGKRQFNASALLLGRFTDDLAAGGREQARTSPRVVSADREFLLASSAGKGSGSAGMQQVLLHDYRDLTFLKRLTAAGVAGTLMSSSALAYAIALNWSAVACGGLVMQTVSAGLVMLMYLRTYVARAVLDPRRSQLLITGCTLVGEPLATDVQVPLAMLEPGASVSEQFIKFRVRGQPWDPSCWIWYRVPRANWAAGSAAAQTGAQVGYRGTAATIVTPAAAAIARAQVEVPSSTSSAGRRFPGAGFGDSAEDDAVRSGPRAPSVAKRPQAGQTSGSASATKEGTETSVAPRKSLALRMEHGLPADAVEEQKLIELFEEPTAYASSAVRH